ncbi:gliding motility lipoprotein GldB [Hyunsoonleella pacifica]|uniref:Gliding motility lipoprotein GldB n=1 Tax=Hyunsoonleella pacifica TaxID=1080224 RepID=A0A4Q9FLP8_9FLAO|nr:gliding motility lipoprotein GldB [Hyunsoonleella pacifica]TBN14701.1 gliding motility lipoprotein GldB [Hyunsoonleella pacifica]GGD15983.1 gliding motility lipoprotein GldB [Hyunsoonleella pacifica]
MKNILFAVFVTILIFSCKDENKQEKAIADINIDIAVERFDQFFGNAKESDLPKIKQAYPFMFSGKYEDSFWITKMNDTLQQELVREIGEKFQRLDDIELEIETLFNHLKYYFPEFKPPRIITTTSNVDYRNKVIITDTIALIALDTYLGKEHYFYEGIQNFIKRDFQDDLIVVDMAKEYSKRYIYQPQRKTLLSEMIYFGKQLYFKDVMVPNKTEAQRIGYTNEELDWARTNEHYIWRYFVERELLYSTDGKLPNRFINSAPFSKFYLEEIDTNSPGRIGQYIGWQIVRAYMKNNTISLKKMLQTQPQDIFNNSKFKPRK